MIHVDLSLDAHSDTPMVIMTVLPLCPVSFGFSMGVFFSLQQTTDDVTVCNIRPSHSDVALIQCQFTLCHLGHNHKVHSCSQQLVLLAQSMSSSWAQIQGGKNSFFLLYGAIWLAF